MRTLIGQKFGVYLLRGPRYRNPQEVALHLAIEYRFEAFQEAEKPRLYESELQIKKKET